MAMDDTDAPRRSAIGRSASAPEIPSENAAAGSRVHGAASRPRRATPRARPLKLSVSRPDCSPTVLLGSTAPRQAGDPLRRGPRLRLI